MFHYRLRPRFSETDGLGHINNAVLPVWFEEARIDIFRIFNPSLQLENWNLILKKYEIEFLAQIWQTAEVDIQTGIAKIGNTSLVVAQRVVQNGEVVAQGQTVLVHFDYKTSQPAPIPDEIRAQLSDHIVDAP